MDLGIDGRVGERNSPTVFNTAFNFRHFWDGRAATLEDLAATEGMTRPAAEALMAYFQSAPER